MSDTLDRLGGFRGAAQTPDRRPSINSQAAIAEYDYRFAAWEVVDGADIKAVCKRLDVPGGPTVLGPKVAALRARLEACAKVGRPPPERPTQAPVSPLTNASASVGLESWRDKARVGIAFDATENASAKEMKGRALVTRSVGPVYTAAPAPAPLDDAPWRQALKLTVSAAAVKAVAEQEGRDPVKELRAAGFAQEAERLRAEIEAAVLAAAVAEPEAPTLASAPRLSAEHPPIGRDFGFGLLAPLPLEFKPTGLPTSPPWLGVMEMSPSVTAIAATADDIPTPTEIAAAEAEAEALWEQTHSEETVLAAQAEHARQRALLQQLGEEDEEEGAEAAVVAPARSAPKAPVARGRSLQTLAASAQTPVVKKLRTARPAANSPAPSASAAPKAQPQVAAPPVKPLPLPTWPEKVKAVPSDPPPKRDRSRNRKVAPKPPEPAQPVLLGMSPETTTPTDIGRPKRRKVATPAPVAMQPKVKAPKVKAQAQPEPVKPPQRARPEPIVVILPDEVCRRVSPEIQQLLIDAVKVCRRFSTGRMPQATDVATFVPIDLTARAELVRSNGQMIMRCPRPAHAKLSDRRWHEQLNLLVTGTISATQLAATAKIPESTVMHHIRRTGGEIRLLPYIDHKRGMRSRRSLPRNPINAATARGMKRLRAMYALTPREFAGCLGLVESTVHRLEQGLELPRPEVIRAAAAAFDVPWREALQIHDDAWLLRELITSSQQGRAGMLYRHMLAKFVLPEFGLASLLQAAPEPETPGPNPTIPDLPNKPTTHSRIEAGPSSISEWSRVRYAVCIGEKETAYADTLKAEAPERVRQLLQNQILINARQGGDGLPRGWSALLPDDLGPGVRGRLKEELMELRDQIDNIEHALGLPARFWSGPDQECDADLTDAERLALNTVITNRSQLLIDPTDANDSCDRFTFDDVAKDCRGDGHYLCLECKRLTGLARRKLIGRPDTDTDDDTQE